MKKAIKMTALGIVGAAALIIMFRQIYFLTSSITISLLVNFSMILLLLLGEFFKNREEK